MAEVHVSMLVCQIDSLIKCEDEQAIVKSAKSWVLMENLSHIKRQSVCLMCNCTLDTFV